MGSHVIPATVHQKRMPPASSADAARSIPERDERAKERVDRSDTDTSRVRATRHLQEEDKVVQPRHDEFLLAFGGPGSLSITDTKTRYRKNAPETTSIGVSLHHGSVKAQFGVRNTSAAGKPGGHAVESAGNGGCSSARSSRSAAAATHKTLPFFECEEEQSTPQTRPRSPDHRRTDPTSPHSAC